MKLLPIQKVRLVALCALWIAVIIGVALLTRAAIRNEKYKQADALTGGNASNGLGLIERYGCAACHLIPGAAPNPNPIGPNLHGISARKLVGDAAANDPELLVRWIVNPSAVNPRTAMPNIGVREQDARDIASYLYAAN